MGRGVVPVVSVSDVVVVVAETVDNVMVTVSVTVLDMVVVTET